MRNEIISSNVAKLSLRAFRSPYELVPKGRVCTLHYHDEMEFIPIFKGALTCTVDGKEYIAHAGEVIFINSGIPHETFAAAGEHQSGLIQFRLRDFMEREIERVIRYSLKYRSLIGAPVHVIRDETFFATVCDLLDECAEEQKGYEMFARAAIYRILGMLYRGEYLSDGLELYRRKEVQKLLPALTYINDNYADELTLSSVSAHLGFNESYFCRIFKSGTGATFTEYLNFVRVCKAEKLLSETQDSIFEIATAVGISSLSYFNRIFRKYHNCSPTTYRNALYAAGV